MVAPQRKNAHVRLLACLVDEEDEDLSDYRVCINGEDVKYITTAPGAFRDNPDDRTFEPLLLGELFPSFPLGAWNSGHVASDLNTGAPVFTKTEVVQLSEIKNVWHAAKFNELDFIDRTRVTQRVQIAKHPKINDGKPVVIKLAVWPWEMDYMEVETAAYQQIANHGIGPKFLGHLTEGRDGRVIGIVIEWWEGARTAEPEDLEGCRKALSKLHRLGIKLGDTNKHNFLVRNGYEVGLIDFETAQQDCSLAELEEEMSGLSRNLADTSGLGGVVRVED